MLSLLKTMEHFIWESIAYYRFIAVVSIMTMINFHSSLETTKEKEQAQYYTLHGYGCSISRLVSHSRYKLFQYLSEPMHVCPILL